MEGKKRKRRPTNFIVLGMLLMICFYVGITLLEQQQEMIQLKKEEQELQSKIDSTQQEIDGITSNIESADTDEYIEKIARENLKMIGSDEVIFIDLGKNNE